MFALGVRYLNGWAMATHPADRERAEWPPHPDRVFMALAAAYFETDGGKEERDALEWLERIEPPELAASKAEPRDVIPTYAPVNDTELSRPSADSPAALAKRLTRLTRVSSLKQAKDAGLALLPEFRSRQKLAFPVVVPHDPDVYLIWRDLTCPSERRAGLATLCGKVTSVGDPSSFVQMWIEGSPPASTLVPDSHGARGIIALRVFGRGAQSGRLVRLENHHKLEQNQGRRLRIACDWVRYRPGEPPVGTSLGPAHSVFDSNVLVLRRSDGSRLGVEATLKLTSSLRNAAMSLCKVQPPPEWITGHRPDGSPSQHPHVAFMPLPDVGHGHADGHVLGLGIAVPRNVSPSDQGALGTLLFDATTGDGRDIELRTGVAVWQVRLDDDDLRLALQSRTWTAAPEGSTVWGTVTPIVFDRHPKQTWGADDAPRVRAEKQAAYWTEVETMIADACGKIGLPRPTEVSATSTATFRGASSAGHMPRMSRKDGTLKRQTHAVLHFAEPVVGPVLLGAGRYRGYGLCRPIVPGGDA